MLSAHIVEQVINNLKGYDVRIGTLTVTNTPGISIHINKEVYIAYSVEEKQVYICSYWGAVLIGVCTLDDMCSFVQDFSATYSKHVRI
jgi:hypothetical protein